MCTWARVGGSQFSSHQNKISLHGVRKTPYLSKSCLLPRMYNKPFSWPDPPRTFPRGQWLIWKNAPQWKFVHKRNVNQNFCKKIGGKSARLFEGNKCLVFESLAGFLLWYSTECPVNVCPFSVGVKNWNFHPGISLKIISRLQNSHSHIWVFRQSGGHDTSSCPTSNWEKQVIFSKSVSACCQQIGFKIHRGSSDPSWVICTSSKWSSRKPCLVLGGGSCLTMKWCLLFSSCCKSGFFCSVDIGKIRAKLWDTFVCGLI